MSGEITRIVGGFDKAKPQYPAAGATLPIVWRSPRWYERTPSQYPLGALNPRVVSGGVIFTKINSGTFRIAGTLKLATSPTHTPAARKVALLQLDTLQVVRSTMSDSGGNYSFESIDQHPGKYMVLGIDQTGQYNADVADNIQAGA